MTSSNATKMDVESDNSGDPTPEQIMEIAAEEVSEAVSRYTEFNLIPTEV